MTSSALRQIHRAVSLTFLLFWLVQATGGVFLVFHREIDDWTLASSGDRPLDMDRLGRRVQALEAERNAAATSIFSSTGYSNRYDIHFEGIGTGTEWTARVDGHGRLLRVRAFDAPLVEGGLYLAANRLHRHLLAGASGAWIVGISGIALLFNIFLGLKLAWPGRPQWRKALLPRLGRSRPVAVYGWHRALGLWLAPLAIVIVACGVLLAFEDQTAGLLGAHGERRQWTASPGSAPVSPAQAVRAALERFPDAEFAGLRMPADGRPVYTVFLRQRSEADRPEGATRVFVGGSSGQIVGAFDPLNAGAADRFMSILKPIHTGGVAGYPGRVAAAATGAWLIAMISLGGALWWMRRRQSARRRPLPPSTGAGYASQDSR
jgi:uncharacterized iron-regulated membrane protein